ncbi:hypothetical protein BLNAU_16885 [Blattamonas nauphoetae]|uniref:Uncharacterized protein n=1 Tax=Blattamonas nauphoetae TaxID=2049346 RepID=A0ABQ9XD04_9EUKA|nr:hypothetical protein BLNAU_16885 [Blattamonas nauphoetae]
MPTSLIAIILHIFTFLNSQDVSNQQQNSTPNESEAELKTIIDAMNQQITTYEQKIAGIQEELSKSKTPTSDGKSQELSFIRQYEVDKVFADLTAFIQSTRDKSSLAKTALEQIQVKIREIENHVSSAVQSAPVAEYNTLTQQLEAIKKNVVALENDLNSFADLQELKDVTLKFEKIARSNIRKSNFYLFLFSITVLIAGVVMFIQTRNSASGKLL